LAPWAHKVMAKRWAFCNGYNEVVFLCNRTDQHEIRCHLLNLNRRIPKISLNGAILPQNRRFGVVLTGLRVTGLQVSGYVFRLS